MACIRGFTTVAVLDQWEARDGYHRWFRRYGLYDYLEDLVPEEDIMEAAAEIVGGKGASLTANNVALVIAHLHLSP